jgi:hypothetical protein
LFGDYPFEMEEDEWFLFQVYFASLHLSAFASFQVSGFRFQVVRIILRDLT